MEHVAIMKKSWGLLPKILSGEKKIESRWYLTKHAPWGRIQAGDIVYFKNSGEPVTLKATVNRVLQFENLTPAKIHEILRTYGKEDGIERGETKKFFDLSKSKKYCILTFLSNVQKVPPFNINKSGFGAMSAWITVSSLRLFRSS